MKRNTPVWFNSRKYLHNQSQWLLQRLYLCPSSSLELQNPLWSLSLNTPLTRWRTTFCITNCKLIPTAFCASSLPNSLLSCLSFSYSRPSKPWPPRSLLLPNSFSTSKSQALSHLHYNLELPCNLLPYGYSFTFYFAVFCSILDICILSGLSKNKMNSLNLM